MLAKAWMVDIINSRYIGTRKVIALVVVKVSFDITELNKAKHYSQG